MDCRETTIEVVYFLAINILPPSVVSFWVAITFQTWYLVFRIMGHGIHFWGEYR